LDDLKRSVFFCVLLWLPIAVLGCGKKGPPLAPLNLLPEPAANVSARRLGSMVYLHMAVPSKNANGPGPVAVDHLEIYAVTAAPGAAAPPNRELLTSARVIGRIPVKPPVSDDEAPREENAPKDTRPGPGDTVTFVETLTEAQLTPQILPTPKPAKPAAPSSIAGVATGTTAAAPVAPPAPAQTSAEPPPGTPAVPAAGTTSIGGASTAPASPTAAVPAPSPGSTPPAAPAPATPATRAVPEITVPTRIYVVRAMTRRGRPGAPSSRLAVPLVPPPPVANALATSFSENAVTVSWLPPVLAMGSTTTAGMAYNVYVAPPNGGSSQDDMPTPLNEKPLEVPAFAHARAAPGIEQCFVVRTVETVAGMIVESEPSARTCITPRDIFPPAAPNALSAVAGPGAINLIWDANTEADVVGYVILRAEAPGDTLQPLNREPIRETRYRDASVTPGVRYVYAIAAVDRAGNRSEPSARFEETAR
jgi:hypothetical protein